MEKRSSSRAGGRCRRGCAPRAMVNRGRGCLVRALALAWVGLAGMLVPLPALALDLPTLDRLSVMMSLDQVRAIAGAPAELRNVPPDLRLAIWPMTDTPGMVAAGGIFDTRGALIALAYMFAGSLGSEVSERMRALGFRPGADAVGNLQLYGKDDDTDRPLIVVIDDLGDTTTVFAYEQGEFERRTSRGGMPPPNVIANSTPIDVAPTPGPAGSGRIDPATRSAMMAGVGMLAAQPPIQRSTTVSSRTSTTHNADGSVTTRSSRVSVGVSVDPAAAANALMMLMSR